MLSPFRILNPITWSPNFSRALARALVRKAMKRGEAAGLPSEVPYSQQSPQPAAALRPPRAALPGGIVLDEEQGAAFLIVVPIPWNMNPAFTLKKQRCQLKPEDYQEVKVFPRSTTGRIPTWDCRDNTPWETMPRELAASDRNNPPELMSWKASLCNALSPGVWATVLAKACCNDSHLPPRAHWFALQQTRPSRKPISLGRNWGWTNSKQSLSNNLLPGVPTHFSCINLFLCWYLVLIFSFTWMWVQYQEQMWLVSVQSEAQS